MCDCLPSLGHISWQLCPEISFSFRQAGESYTLSLALPLSLTKQFQEQNLIPSPAAKAPESHHQSILERNFETKLIRETSILSLRDYYLMHYEKSTPKEGNFSSYGLLVPNAWLALKDSKNNKNPVLSNWFPFIESLYWKWSYPLNITHWLKFALGALSRDVKWQPSTLPA